VPELLLLLITSHTSLNHRSSTNPA